MTEFEMVRATWSAPGFAAWNGQDDVLRDLFSRDQERIHEPDSEGLTPIHLASLQGHHHTVYMLVAELGGDPMVVDNGGSTALHRAAEVNHVAAITVLVSSLGVDANLQDEIGRTAMSIAATRGFSELAWVLGSRLGASPNAVNDVAHSPLYCAAWNGHEPTVGALLELGACVDEQDFEGCTAFHAAAHSGFASILKLLAASAVGRMGSPAAAATVNVSDNFGYTALHFAAARGHVEAAVTLVAFGASVDCRDHDGWTPLLHCVEEGHVAAAHALLELGAATTVVVRGGLSVSAGLLAHKTAEHASRTARSASAAVATAVGAPETTTAPTPPPMASPSGGGGQGGEGVAAAISESHSQEGFKDVADLFGRLEALCHAAQHGHVEALVREIDSGRAFAPKQWVGLLPVLSRAQAAVRGVDGGGGGGSALGFCAREELLRWTTGVMGDARACFLALYGPTADATEKALPPAPHPPPPPPQEQQQEEDVASALQEDCDQVLVSGPWTRRQKRRAAGGGRGGSPPPPRRRPSSKPRTAGALDRGHGRVWESFGSAEDKSLPLLRRVVHDGHPLVRQLIVSFLVHLPSPHVRALVRRVHAELEAAEGPRNGMAPAAHFGELYYHPLSSVGLAAATAAAAAAAASAAASGRAGGEQGPGSRSRFRSLLRWIRQWVHF